MSRMMKKFTDRRSDIVKAASHLFRTKKYDKSTMQDIMDTLGIAKGTIYHYFKSKEAILEAVIEDIVEKNIEKLQILIKKEEGSALQKMKLLVKTSNMSDENKNILDQLHQPGNDALHNRLLAATLLKQAPLYAELIQKGCEEGIFETENPLECAEFILSATQFLTDVGIYPWTQEDLKRRIQAFPRLIERQLKAPKGSFQFLADEMKS